MPSALVVDIPSDSNRYNVPDTICFKDVNILCAEHTPCYDICCSNNTASDCRLDSRPHKDLLSKVKACSYKTTCSQQQLGWVSLGTSGAGCSEFGRRTNIVYSQLAQLNYYCIHGQQIYINFLFFTHTKLTV